MARLSNVRDYAIAVHMHWHLFWFYAKNQDHRSGLFGRWQKYDGISDCIIADRKVNARKSILIKKIRR